MEVFFEHHGFTVDVDHVSFWPYDGGLMGLNDIDLGRLIHVFAQEIAAHDGKFKRIGLANDTEIDLAVPKRCPWRNGHVIAHLVGVGKRDEEGFGGKGTLWKDNGVLPFT